MHTYKQIGYGSQGSDVTELQKLLNQNGYNLEEDGVYGPRTEAAFNDYQKKNAAAMDTAQPRSGQKSTPAAAPAPTNHQTGTGAGSPPAYGAYQPSDAVTQAQQLLAEHLAQKPGAYQSPWQGQINDIVQQMLNREKFSYDLNGDALYQQLKDQYMMQGQQAAMDTMGQAAAMTGGYGNSFAQTAAQQTYQGYLQKLNDRVPDLYQMALDKYQMEGQGLLNQYSILGDQEEQDYGRYRDQMSDYYAELDRRTEDARYREEMDYGRWADDRNFQYQQDRDQVADQQWQAAFDEDKRRYDQEYEQSLKKYTSGGSRDADDEQNTGIPVTEESGYSEPKYDPVYSNQGYSADVVMRAQEFLGVPLNGLWGPEAAAQAKAKGYNSLADVVAAMDQRSAAPKGSPGDSYYEQLMGAVATAKDATGKQDPQTRQATYKETVAAIEDAYKSGKITKEQRDSLLRSAMPGAR